MIDQHFPFGTRSLHLMSNETGSVATHGAVHVPLDIVARADGYTGPRRLAG